MHTADSLRSLPPVITANERRPNAAPNHRFLPAV